MGVESGLMIASRLKHGCVASIFLWSSVALPFGLGAEHEGLPASGDQLQPANPSLRADLLRRAERDQEVRIRLVAFARTHKLAFDSDELTKRAKSILEEMAGIDSENACWLKMVITQHGWPGRTLVGRDGAHAAFLLVQHASRDRELQRECLRLMEAAPNGEVAGPDWALLTDRVRLAEGKKQLYGTQIEFREGTWQIQGEVEDPDRLDERRKQLGLPPLDEYLQMAAELYGRGE